MDHISIAWNSMNRMRLKADGDLEAVVRLVLEAVDGALQLEVELGVDDVGAVGKRVAPRVVLVGLQRKRGAAGSEADHQCQGRRAMPHPHRR
jgi:hypothetical protein